MRTFRELPVVKLLGGHVPHLNLITRSDDGYFGLRQSLALASIVLPNIVLPNADSIPRPPS